MKTGVVIFSFSGVYAMEGFMEALSERGVTAEVLDFSALEGAQCYCDAEAESRIRAQIDSMESRRPGSAGPCRVHWIDSGDYHYMSKLFAERIAEPFTLVLLDHHPDDQAPGFGEILSCGGWVRELKKDSRALERVISVGPEGELKGLEDLRKALKETAPERIYVSLDKDVMGRDAARTDWSQGNLGLKEVKDMLRLLFGCGAEILGIDICGELTEAKGARAEDYAVNLKTNIEIQELINDYLN